ncbi:MAG: carboxypeptidase-like regulatory domain-containing protein [Clostridiales bacterium]|nr:carboxypeptidase-like regulatory domain-containing protein [Clostridiales bacterium]
MRIKNLLKSIGLLAMIGCLATIGQSCSEDKELPGNSVVGEGSVTGTVVDEMASPVAGVTVIDLKSEKSTTTSTDGTYTLSGIPIQSEGQIISFSKEKYETTSVTLTPSKFSANVATANIEMVYAAAVIKGRITDARNNDAPLQGVSVSVSSTKSSVTDADGRYEITGLALRNYTLTISKANYATVTKSISVDDFVDGVFTYDTRIGGVELLRGLTAEDLRVAPRWYNNEYKGGRNADAYPMFDWACNYMGSFTTWTGDYEEQNEGSTLRIRNSSKDQANPADDKNFDTFVYGRKLITRDNSKLTVQVRTHQPPCYWGVQIIDLTAAEPKVELVGSIRMCDTGSYMNELFDLSPWEGKEVVVVIGQFRMETGDYWHQLVLRRIAFTNEAFTDVIAWMPGTEIADLPGWRMTESMVRSSMPQDRTHYTGISPVSGNRDNYINGYRTWRDAGHVMGYWTLMPLHKDPEVFVSEGYIIKTRGNGAPDTLEPEQYVYAKFSVSNGHNKLRFTTRNFGSNFTFFKLTAIDMDCKAKFIAPVSNTAQEAAAAADGCWKFKSGDAFCEFVYDLSEYNGQDVMIAISVHNGEKNGDENKLVLNAIDIE